MVLGELLHEEYLIRAASTGQRALEVAVSDPKPDLILLDVMMPEMDGYSVLKCLREQPDTCDIPVIFITALSTQADEEKGLQLGAVDYITKPFNPAIVKARVKTQLELKDSRDRLSRHNLNLEAEVEKRIWENALIRDLTTRALACMAEMRDKETGLHIMRTQKYVELLAERLQEHPRFRDALQGERRRDIVRAAPLHDIGKIGIPDAILLKPGPLTAAEFTVMKTHSVIGASAIDSAIEQALMAFGSTQSGSSMGAINFLRVASEIARSHHERWDGSGYPDGLSGDRIPVSARLMALADVFDALTEARVYKSPMSIEQAVEVISEGRATHFDPDVVDAFMACLDQFADVAERLREPDQWQAGA
ncbi:response regulator [Marinobacterium sp. AK62]|uniref:Response regulator n=2 Tax=Marinobacterium alkalitolerans TaxID=1542925 RepID=A0ABS3Z998_9GAMM|nr:response regulator [Marinobacterium alkalitolerans]